MQIKLVLTAKQILQLTRTRSRRSRNSGRHGGGSGCRNSGRSGGRSGCRSRGSRRKGGLYRGREKILSFYHHLKEHFITQYRYCIHYTVLVWVWFLLFFTFSPSHVTSLSYDSQSYHFSLYIILPAYYIDNYQLQLLVCFHPGFLKGLKLYIKII